ncbi:hypothetical protein Pcaca05_00140 [Pectobacterium carotovorum subsp. carotovorum]|nr:hypothetical protein Pcaca05_00140 [Pectobacterium carotovorum subsp. carotovorum]
MNAVSCPWIDHLTRLSNSDWITLKKQIEQHELMAAMSHKDWLSRRQQQKQEIERAHTLGKYRGKQAGQERH